MNSALTSRESGARLFYVTLDGRGNGGGGNERVAGGDRRGENTRAEMGKNGGRRKKRLNTSRKWY